MSPVISSMRIVPVAESYAPETEAPAIVTATVLPSAPFKVVVNEAPSFAVFLLFHF